MKKLCVLLGFFLFLQANAQQVGINTETPQGVFDITTLNNTGLVLPRVANIEAVTDGKGNSPVNGTVVYDLSRDKTCFYIAGDWLCIGKDGNGIPGIAIEGIPFVRTSTYVKASNTGTGDRFGLAVSLSEDGNTMAVYSRDNSNATGINGSQSDNSAMHAGAVYVFVRNAGVWTQEAFIKASNTDAEDYFGHSISLSADGNTLAVGANREDSNATGINGNQSDNSATEAGAVYVFERTTGWAQTAYIKAANTGAGDLFGESVSLSNDGNTLAVGAYLEDSRATGINGDAVDNSLSGAGAVYLFRKQGGNWTQQAYIKASNTNTGDNFGISVSLSGDGLFLAVGAEKEKSNAIGVGGDQLDNSFTNTGAAYVFISNGGVWSQDAYIKASNTNAQDNFGHKLSINNDGTMLVVGAHNEESDATGVNGNQMNNLASDAGACYVFARSNGVWTQEAYLKASNTDPFDNFGDRLSISGDGQVIVVGAPSEDSNTTGANGDQANNSTLSGGAAYVFKRSGGTWSQETYLKASNTNAFDVFGASLSLSGDGKTLVVGANGEESNAVSINGDQTNNSFSGAGAVFIFE